jgi:hypothetical protein
LKQAFDHTIRNKRRRISSIAGAENRTLLLLELYCCYQTSIAQIASPNSKTDECGEW